MKSDLVKKLLRALVTALGIGLGSVLAFVIVQLNAMAGNPAMSIGALLALYAAFALLLGLGGYLIAPRTIDSITRLIALVERVTPNQRTSAMRHRQHRQRAIGGKTFKGASLVRDSGCDIRYHR